MLINRYYMPSLAYIHNRRVVLAPRLFCIVSASVSLSARSRPLTNVQLPHCVQQLQHYNCNTYTFMHIAALATCRVTL